MGLQEFPSIDIVLDETRRTLDSQFQQIDSLDTKSGIVLGIAGVVLTLLITSMFGQTSNIIHSWLIRLALIPIILSLFMSFVSISIRRWKRPPDLERLWSHYKSQAAEETKLELIKVSKKSVEDNEKNIVQKGRFLKTSYFVLAAGLVILVVWVALLW